MRSRSDICSIPMLARGARCRCRGLSGYQRPSAIRCVLCHTSPHRTRWGQAQPGGRVEPTEQATVKTGAATGVLTRRMLGGVVLGVLAFGLVYRLALMVRDDMTIAIAAGRRPHWPSVSGAVAHGRPAGVEAGRAAGALRGGPRRCADGPAHRVGQSPRLPGGARSAGRGGPSLQRPALAPSRRPRRLQVDQRHPRPCQRGPCPARIRRAC